MNVLVIVADTFRRDQLGCYGGGTGTPHLDALAAESVVFDDAYCASFPTLPCRAEVFTGRITFPYLDWGPLPASELHVAEVFADARRHTALVFDNFPMGRNRYGYDRGFHTRWRIRGQWYDPRCTLPAETRWPVEQSRIGEPERVRQYLANVADRRGEEDYFAPQTVSAACDWLERYGRRDPFFLWVDIFDPHEPWDPPAAYLRPEEADIPWILYPRFGEADRYEEPELEAIRALYRGEVRMVDHWIGRLLRRVDELGLRDDTVVVFLSDHGLFFGEHGLLGKASKASDDLRGWPTYVEVSRIPLMLRIPGQAPGRRSGFVHPGDLTPALLQLAGVKTPARMTARNLLPMVREEAPGRELAVSSWSLRGWRTTRPSVIRDDEWTLVFWRSGVPPELYHRALDPGERCNVVDRHPGEVRRLHGEYLRFLRENETPSRSYMARRWLVSWGGSSAWEQIREGRQAAGEGKSGG